MSLILPPGVRCARKTGRRTSHTGSLAPAHSNRVIVLVFWFWRILSLTNVIIQQEGRPYSCRHGLRHRPLQSFAKDDHAIFL
jgi:hypothetical protein